jgi:hypothetical protein
MISLAVVIQIEIHFYILILLLIIKPYVVVHFGNYNKITEIG